MWKRFKKCRETVCPDRSGIPTGETDRKTDLSSGKKMYKLRNRRQCECEGSSSESGRAGKCAVPFHSDTFTGCPYHVSEVCHGNPPQPDGKRFLPDGSCSSEKEHGKLGNPLQRGLVYTDLWKNSWMHDSEVWEPAHGWDQNSGKQRAREKGKQWFFYVGFAKWSKWKNKSYTISLFQNPQQESCCQSADRISWISHNGCLHSIRESEHGRHKEQLLLVACAKILCWKHPYR